MDLFAAISLLLLEFHSCLLLLLLLLLLIHLRSNHASLLILHQTCHDHATHSLLFGKGRLGLELVVDGFDDACET